MKEEVGRQLCIHDTLTFLRLLFSVNIRYGLSQWDHVDEPGTGHVCGPVLPGLIYILAEGSCWEHGAFPRSILVAITAGTIRRDYYGLSEHRRYCHIFQLCGERRFAQMVSSSTG
jgi:hypothetical protein